MGTRDQSNKDRSTRTASDVPVLGVDIGGVLVDRSAHNSDPSFFGSRPMETPAVPDCFDALEVLSEMFGGRVHIVSKAGPRTARRSTEWLEKHRAFRYVPRQNLWFVDRRADKAPICERLKVTHFVDDRLDVLQHLS